MANRTTSTGRVLFEDLVLATKTVQFSHIEITDLGECGNSWVMFPLIIPNIAKSPIFNLEKCRNIVKLVSFIAPKTLSTGVVSAWVPS